MRKLLLLFFICKCTWAVSQTTNAAYQFKQSDFVYNITKVAEKITIDGLLNEAAWQYVDTFSAFWMKLPKDNILGNSKTSVKMCYDDKNIYFAFVCYSPKPFVGQSLKRDSRIRENDGVSIVLDPVNKKNTAYYFSITAFNVQADDQLASNMQDFTFSWDNKWFSQVKQYDDKYIVEVAIPFTAIKYDAALQDWGINLVRSDRKINEFSTWTRMPINFRAFDFGFLGTLHWKEKPPQAQKNIIAIPYINTSLANDKQNNIATNAKFTAGTDIRIPVSSSLLLDATINPDFSQIEVDKQVTNLTRFDIFFPERRNFFLENNDLFSNYGNGDLSPFYSRRIGLDENGKAIPIIGGARLSGNLTEKTRIGILDMQTLSKGDYTAQNYFATSVSQQVLKRSFIKGYYLQHTQIKNDKPTAAIDKRGANTGFSLNFINNKSSITAISELHYSIKPSVTNKNLFFSNAFSWQNRKWLIDGGVDVVGKNYYTDMGFSQRIDNYNEVTGITKRLGYKATSLNIDYSIYPKNSKINSHRFSFDNGIVFTDSVGFTERTHQLNWNINLKNTANLKFTATNSEVNLIYPTSFGNGVPLPAKKYTYSQTGINYTTDTRKKLSVWSAFLVGNYFGGDYFQYRGGVVLRKQPYFTLDFNWQYDKIQFSPAFGYTEAILISPRVEVNFSNNLFWTTFFQYNTLADNFNINSRLQWRYKPMSDIFLVFTDNYFTDNFMVNKNKNITLKVTYWLSK